MEIPVVSTYFWPNLVQSWNDIFHYEYLSWDEIQLELCNRSAMAWWVGKWACDQEVASLNPRMARYEQDLTLITFCVLPTSHLRLFIGL